MPNNKTARDSGITGCSLRLAPLVPLPTDRGRERAQSAGDQNERVGFRHLLGRACCGYGRMRLLDGDSRAGINHDLPRTHLTIETALKTVAPDHGVNDLGWMHEHPHWIALQPIAKIVKHRIS